MEAYNYFEATPSAFFNGHIVNSVNEESPFLGIGEGKWKAKREAKQSGNSSGSDSSGGLDNSGGSGGGFLNVLGSIFGGTLGLAGTVAPILPALGIGSKSRIKEAQAMGSIELSREEAEAQNQKELIIIGGGFALALLFILVALKR